MYIYIYIFLNQNIGSSNRIQLVATKILQGTEPHMHTKIMYTRHNKTGHNELNYYIAYF